MNRAAELKREGKPVISFSAGEPDFDTPADIRHAASAAMENHMTHYSSARGELCLREEIAKKILRDTGVDYDPETEILVTSGGSEAIFNTMEALVNRGMKSLSPFRPLETMKLRHSCRRHTGDGAAGSGPSVCPRSG